MKNSAYCAETFLATSSLISFQCLEKKAEVFENLITEEQVKTFEESDFSEKAKALLGNPPKKLSRPDYCNVRDFLFSEIHFGNACRSGVTANLMMEEFEKAKNLPDGRVNIKVKRHKTRRSYGAANLTLTREQYAWMVSFVNSFRSRLPIEHHNIFLSWSGKDQKSGAISDRMHQVWFKCGIFGDLQPSTKLCANVIRKTASTLLRESNNPHARQAADSMAHSMGTVEKDYFLRNFEKSSTVGASAISSVFRPTTPSKKKKWTLSEESKLLEEFGTNLATVSINQVRSSPLKFETASPKQVVSFSRFCDNFK